MIGKLRGVFEGSSSGKVVLDVNGVGYNVNVPVSTLLELNGECSLYIHTAVREDAIDLYGFLTEEELSFFTLLISVSGIGPKTALGILNVADVKTLKRSIAGGDATMLSKVYGIGKKSAERIVVELRDKLGKEIDMTAIVGSDAEVIEALMALGYRADESRQALKHVGTDITGTHERLAGALKNLATRTQ